MANTAIIRNAYGAPANGSSKAPAVARSSRACLKRRAIVSKGEMAGSRLGAPTSGPGRSQAPPGVSRSPSACAAVTVCDKAAHLNPHFA